MISFLNLFSKIPHKSLGSLVEHYYKTKKKQNFKCGYKRYVDIEANCSFSSSDDDNTDRFFFDFLKFFFAIF